MAEKEIVLINKAGQLFAINFQGAFPLNKWANADGKIRLTEPEYEFVQTEYPHILGKQLVLEGQEPEGYNENDSLSPEAFFLLQHNKAKSVMKELSDEKLKELIDYADLNDIKKAIVKELEDQYLASGE